MFCSTIIPTIDRPALAGAVASVLEQLVTGAAFEVIVVNDTGRPLRPAPWQRSPLVRIVPSAGRERAAARNTGAAIACGEYLHFLDDDDVLLPGALDALRRLQAAHPDATWLCGAWQTVDRADRFIAEFQPRVVGNIFPLLVAGEGLPLQASLLRAADFAGSGGFDVRPDVLGVEDRELGRRVALHGSAACTETVVARIRVGRAGSTTNWEAIAERDRIGREQVLARPEAAARIRAARPSSYWRGRLARAYLGSTLLNLGRRQPLGAAGRAAQALALAHAHVVTPAFWRGLRMRPETNE